MDGQQGDREGRMMTASQWLTIIGLTADIVGFGLIVWEWQKGIRQAQAEAIEAALNVGAWGIEEDEKSTVRAKVTKELNAALRPRKRAFTIGAALIVLGFACQIAGTALGSQVNA
jgi:hypothetical protein